MSESIVLPFFLVVSWFFGAVIVIYSVTLMLKREKTKESKMELWKICFYGHLAHNDEGDKGEDDRIVFVIAESLLAAMRIVQDRHDQSPLWESTTRLDWGQRLLELPHLNINGSVEQAIRDLHTFRPPLSSIAKSE